MTESDVTSVILTIAGAAGAIVASTFFVIRYINGRIDNGDNILHKKIEAKHNMLALDISGIKNEYVKRVDLDREVEGLSRAISELKTDVGSRIDEVKESQKDGVQQIKEYIEALIKR